MQISGRRVGGAGFTPARGPQAATPALADRSSKRSTAGRSGNLGAHMSGMAWRWRSVALVAALLLAAACAPTGAPTAKPAASPADGAARPAPVAAPAKLVIGRAGQGAAPQFWAGYVADRKGFFAQENLAIEQVAIP